MIEPQYATQVASDGYRIHTTRWVPDRTARGRVVVLHGVQSHGGWYHGLGRRLAEAGYHVVFPDRRGSGANQVDRGHAPSSSRLLEDLAQLLGELKQQDPSMPIALAGISWGGKLAVLAAGKHPDRVDALALICPGLHPRVDVSSRDRLAIAWALLTNRRKTFPIPLADPALFTANPGGQAYIAADTLSLRVATAGLLASSAWIDRQVRRIAPRVRQPALLMLAGRDRIVDNARTLAYFERLPSRKRTLIEYAEAHHTLEFEAEPERYALDLVAWLDQTWAPSSQAGAAQSAPDSR
ncbi:MAG TPA: alpha/beta fold hydrolase [Isosphaeraceae bacterium]|nr:alpha/beta fold hydrolase [Isosphaeraceae bacterium]